MLPTDKGAFCSSCKKEVIDFTGKTNYELAKLLDNKQNICGKFKSRQLDVYISSSRNKKKSNIGVILGMSTFLSISHPIISQNKPVAQEIVEKEKLDKTHKKPRTKKVRGSVKIQGHVFEESGGLPGALVQIKGSNKTVDTDFEGNFSIKIKRQKLEKNPILVFSYLGYKSKEIKIDQKTKFVKVEMEEEEGILMGVIIVKDKNIFRRIGNLFKRKENRVKTKILNKYK